MLFLSAEKQYFLCTRDDKIDPKLKGVPKALQGEAVRLLKDRLYDETRKCWKWKHSEPLAVRRHLPEQLLTYFSMGSDPGNPVCRIITQQIVRNPTYALSTKVIALARSRMRSGRPGRRNSLFSSADPVGRQPDPLRSPRKTRPRLSDASRYQEAQERKRIQSR